jgi:hypothetical protein
VASLSSSVVIYVKKNAYLIEVLYICVLYLLMCEAMIGVLGAKTLEIYFVLIIYVYKSLFNYPHIMDYNILPCSSSELILSKLSFHLLRLLDWGSVIQSPQHIQDIRILFNLGKPD